MSSSKSMGRLTGKVAFVTGGASGMGLASVERFVAEGASVVVADVREDGDGVLKGLGDKIRYIYCDVSQEADVQRAIALAEATFGGLDIVFNNAGIVGTPAVVEDMPIDGWDRLMAVNVRGPMLGIKHGIPALKRRGGGSIINTASTAGLHAGLGNTAYAVSKAACVALTRKAAAECGPHNIRVNSICPGYIATPIFGDVMGLPRAQADAMALELRKGFGTMQPIPRGGVPEDIAAAALFLASDESAFISGTEIVVDGAMLVRQREEIRPDSPPGSAFHVLNSARLSVAGL
jgi:NAD(P)-dependent dehydrogenase (short-subunit alcohol dehydrogenase family)